MIRWCITWDIRKLIYSANVKSNTNNKKKKKGKEKGGRKKRKKEKKRRRIEEERKPQMGWSKPKSPEWSTVRGGED